METGTLNHEGIAGAGAAVEFLASLGDGRHPARAARRAPSRRSIERGQELVERLWTGLAEIARGDAVRPAAGPAAHADGGASPSTAGASDEVATALAAEGVFVSNGDFYATTVVARLGSPRAGWCVPGAPATRPPRRWTGCWRASRRGW